MAQELSQDIKRLQEALYELDNFHGALKGTLRLYFLIEMNIIRVARAGPGQATH